MAYKLYSRHSIVVVVYSPIYTSVFYTHTICCAVFFIAHALNSIWNCSFELCTEDRSFQLCHCILWYLWLKTPHFFRAFVIWFHKCHFTCDFSLLSLSHFISHCGFVLDFINIKTQRIWSINVIISIEWREERICQRVYFTWITYPFSFLISIVMLFFYQVIKDVPVNIIHSRFVVLFFIYLEPLRWLPHSMQCEKFLVVTERRFRNGRTNRMRRKKKTNSRADSQVANWKGPKREISINFSRLRWPLTALE